MTCDQLRAIRQAERCAILGLLMACDGGSFLPNLYLKIVGVGVLNYLVNELCCNFVCMYFRSRPRAVYKSKRLFTKFDAAANLWVSLL